MWPYHREFMIGQILDLCKVSDSFVFVFDFVWFWDGSHLGLFLNHCLYSGVQYLFLLLVLGGRGWVFGNRGLHSFYTQPVSWRGKQKLKYWDVLSLYECWGENEWNANLLMQCQWVFLVMWSSQFLGDQTPFLLRNAAPSLHH